MKLIRFGCALALLGSAACGAPALKATIGGQSFDLTDFVFFPKTTDTSSALALLASDGNACAVVHEPTPVGADGNSTYTGKVMLALVGVVASDSQSVALPTGTGNYPVSFIDSAPSPGNFAEVSFFAITNGNDALHPDASGSAAQAGDATGGTLALGKLNTATNGQVEGTLTLTVGPQKDKVQSNFTAKYCAPPAAN